MRGMMIPPARSATKRLGAAQPASILSVSSPSQNEGNSGTSMMTFTVSVLGGAKGYAIKFDYATADGTATAGSDYTATSGTKTIPAGATNTTVDVPIIGDTTVESDETFFLDVFNVRYQ